MNSINPDRPCGFVAEIKRNGYDELLDENLDLQFRVHQLEEELAGRPESDRYWKRVALWLLAVMFAIVWGVCEAIWRG